MKKRLLIREWKRKDEAGNASVWKTHPAPAASARSSLDRISALHRMVGNQAVQRLVKVSALQPKLVVGKPNDLSEQEADRVAKHVTDIPESAVSDPQSAVSKKKNDVIHKKPACLSSSADRSQPDIGACLRNLQGGEALPASTRAYFEPRFGFDFSHVRVHRDSAAAETAQQLRAHAFTLGNDIVFGPGSYQPQTPKGQRLFAHELTHVLQQQGSRENSGLIQRWKAEEHGRITKAVITSQYAGAWSKDATLHSAYYSGEMDLRGCNYLWFLPPKIRKALGSVPIIGPVVKETEKFPIIGPPAEKLGEAYYALSEYEAPNHGEANLYEKANTNPVTGKGLRTWINRDRMKRYARKAALMANEEGLHRQVFIELGQGLHVGQDRGAHDEGIAGMGHDKPGWEPDNPSVNKAGYTTAKDRTKEVLDLFSTKLTAERRNELKTVVLGALAGPSPVTIGAVKPGPSPVIDEPTLPSRPPLFYMGITKGMFTDKSGLPVRLGGIFPPLYHTGLVYMGGKGNTIAFDQQIGLRLMRITPKVYVDVFGGGVLGANFTDRSIMAGVSSAVHVTYTGKESDYGVMLNKIWDLVGNQNLLVIGVGGTFDETRWLK